MCTSLQTIARLVKYIIANAALIVRARSGPRAERLRAIATEYVKNPQAALVVAPDNQSRKDLNDVIHRAMQHEGHVDREEHRTPVLVPRQDITGADRQWAERYEEGDVARYSRGRKVATTRASSRSVPRPIRSRSGQMTTAH